ncbi:MAG TPA: CoA transferase [Myxococcota bacterium]|jgi:crotonobetainyl-CoA:carnitine CoA-transferase CaiB-like acyl-CoA transferase
MLRGYRVLDFTDERGLLAGQILADLGADVVHIEPPGGSRARARGPEGSLLWWAYARNQRSIVLDLEDAEDRRLLFRLLASADFLIESESPGVMEARGLGYPSLRRDHPGLIYVSISPYGQSGPKGSVPATDLTLAAASGLLFMTGDADRPPVRVSGNDQSWLFAGLEAALGALVASQYRLRTGRGQWVDASAQQALNAATQSDALSAWVGDRHTTRSAGGLIYGGVKIQLLYPAKDGFVSIAFLFGATIGAGTARLMRVIFEKGFCDEATCNKDWIAYAGLLTSGAEPIEEFERVKQIVARFTLSMTKQELLQLAVERNLLMAPVATVADLLASSQLAAREYFQDHDHPGRARPLRYPGPFARFGRSPIAYTRPAPGVDEHAREIRDEIQAARAASPRPVYERSKGARPLEGVKIVDLMWAVAGPTATRVFADHGATIVRVESPTRVDACRTLRPFRGGKPSPEGSALFHTLNVGKQMMTLDLASDAGREVFRDLVRWADVLAESYSPQVMGRLGFSYDELAKLNPGLIVLSTSLMGKTGPLNTFGGYGNMASAWCGFYEVAGWPDRDPAGPWGAYTDFIAARYNAIAVLAALEHRQRTGEGQHIDLAQAEASIHFLAPAILDYQVSGRLARRTGNLDPRMTPHAVYPVRGEDRWIAIAVEDDEQRRALGEILGARQTADWEGPELEARLQAAGVPAALVLDGADVARDPQLLARGHFIEIPHPEGGTTAIEGPRVLLSESPGRPGRVVPTLGRDNDRILREILGYDEARISALVIAGALG